MPIKVLDNKTIAQIAAGEVVERPASVVKELVENALDAGATQITVEVRGGGVSLVRVMDNGSGITSDEVALAFERHATSKIGRSEDLQSISSLGFRGEALPSIAAVADVEVVTRADGEAAGTAVNLEGGVITGRRNQARSRGTTITVRNLFRKVPARLKFLKSVATENGRIADVVSQYALAYPGVSLALSIDGKEKLRTSGRGKLLDSIIDVYGVELAGRMLPVEDAGGEWSDGRVTSEIKVTGMVGSPELGRSGRGYLSFFINRRWVSSRLLAYAVEEAYQGLLMVGRHPVVVLNISLPPTDVDVNIHPAKSEVKFRRESDVFRAVQRAVRATLTAQMPVPRIEEVAAAYAAPTARGHSSGTLPLTVESAPPAEEAASPLIASLPVLRVVGQVMNSYIVAEGPDGLYLIDQHAAHERVRFEMVRQQREKRQPEVQGLLEPAAFEVTPRQDAVMKEGVAALAEFGFSLEDFGDRTYLVRAVPALLAGDSWDGMLRELLDELAGEARSQWEEKIVASIACHNAIRSGQALSDDEMRELVRQLERCARPHTCPHGRPTVIRLSTAQLEREFGRG